MEEITQFCTLYLVRHGQTEWNAQGILQGHLDSELSEKGIQQAKNLAKELRNIKFDAVYSSDLLRAKRTAEIITLEHTLSIKTTELLRERKLGKYEGKPIKMIAEEVDSVFEKLTDQERFIHKVSDDIESDEELVNRMITFLREASVTHPNQTILVTTHAEIIRILLIHIGFATYKNFAGGIGKIENTAYIKLKSDGVDIFLEETKGIQVENKQ